MDHGIAPLIFFACFFLLGISGIEHYFKRAALPPVCWIMIAGILYGFSIQRTGADLPKMNLDPEIVLFVFLPVLIFDSARKLRLKELRAVRTEVSVFATIGVVASMFLIGVPIAKLAKIPLIDALLFGAILSATDPIAVTAIFSRFDLPEKLRTLVEGESLFNDATTVVLFTLVSMSVLEGTAFSVQSGIVEFVVSLLGATVLGVALGAAGYYVGRLWHELHDRFIGALLPLITVYLTFGIAEHVLHVSGVIAVMAATMTWGVVHGRHHARSASDVSADSFFDSFWEFVGHLANSVLFFMLGAEIGMHDYSDHLTRLPLYVLVLVVARSIVVYAGSGVMGIAGKRTPLGWQHVLNIAGLKGALSIALILLIPHSYPIGVISCAWPS
jgi:CPA1 family monovalent cation:H+ antiporter